MQKRSPITVLLLSLVTFGIYSIIWQVQTTREMRKYGADIPNCILMIIPIANIYFLWKYCEGVEKVSSGKYTAILMFLLFWLTGIIGIFLAQTAFNEVNAAPAPGGSPMPMQAPAMPQAAPEAPVAPVATEAPVSPEVAPTVAPAPEDENSQQQPSAQV